MSFPVHRPRRLRRSPAVRRLVAQTRLHPADLVLPVFVREGIAEPVPISSMPGVVQHTLDSLVAEAERAVAAGLGGLMVFGVPEAKDGRGSGADDPGGILNVALTRLAEAVGDDRLYRVSCEAEKVMWEEKELFPNADFFHASAYHYMGIPTKLFTPIFVCSRVTGLSCQPL